MPIEGTDPTVRAAEDKILAAAAIIQQRRDIAKRNANAQKQIDANNKALEEHNAALGDITEIAAAIPDSVQQAAAPPAPRPVPAFAGPASGQTPAPGRNVAPSAPVAAAAPHVVESEAPTINEVASPAPIQIPPPTQVAQRPAPRPVVASLAAAPHSST